MQTDLYRSQLKTLIHKKDQSLPKQAQTAKCLTRQAPPDASQSMQEELVRYNFIDMLKDADVHWHIKQTHPQTLRAALTTAIELEAFQIADHQLNRANPTVLKPTMGRPTVARPYHL